MCARLAALFLAVSLVSVLEADGRAVTAASDPSSDDKPGCTHLSAIHPAVYVTYESEPVRLVSREPRRGRDWYLRLHNNSDCAIRVRCDDLMGVPAASAMWHVLSREREPDGLIKTVSELRVPADTAIMVCFDVQRRSRTPMQPVGYLDSDDQRFFYTIRPGETLAFPVAERYVTQQWIISIPFSYEWEQVRWANDEGTVEHRVYYTYGIGDE